MFGKAHRNALDLSGVGKEKNMRNRQLIHLLRKRAEWHVDESVYRSVMEALTLNIPNYPKVQASCDTGPTELFQQIDTLWERDLNAEAAALLELVRHDKPHDEAVLVRLFTSYNRCGLVEEGLAVLEDLCRVTPTNDSHIWALAQQYFCLNRYNEAREKLLLIINKSSISLDPLSTARILFAAGDFNEAANILYGQTKATRQILPQVLHKFWTEVLISAFGLSPARIRLAKLREKDEQNCNLLFQLSVLLERAGHFVEADQGLARCIALSPTSPAPHISRARLNLLRGGNVEPSVAVYSQMWDGVAKKIRQQSSPLKPAVKNFDLEPRADKIVTPFIYLPIELSGRELSTRLLLSVVAAARGLQLFLCSRSTLQRAAPNLPPGVILHKSANSFDQGLIESRMSRGHIFCVTDEEAFGWVGDDRSLMRNVNNSLVRNVDVIFAPGTSYHVAASARIAPVTPKVVTVGNLRTDVISLLKVGRAGAKAEALSPQKKNLLVCTNFGGWNAANIEYTGVCMNALTASSGAPSEEYLNWLLKIYKDGTLAECLNFKEIIAAVTELSKKLPDISIVVRPHPAESLGTWETIFTGLKNVVIDKAGDLMVALQDAFALIHLPGCATGIEAFLLGCPAISYNKVKHLNYPKMGLSYALSQSVENLPELASIVSQHVAAHGARFIPSDDVLDKFKHTIRHDNELVSQRIIEEICHRVDFTQNGEASEAFDLLIESDNVEKASLALTSSTLAGKRLKQSLVDIQAQVEMFATKLALPVPIVKQGSDGVFWISPA